MDMRQLIDLITERAVGGPQLTVYEGPTPQELQTAQQTDPDGRVLGLLADDRLFIWPATYADPRDIMERFGVNRFRAIPLEMTQQGPMISGGSRDYAARATQMVQQAAAIQKLYGQNVRVAMTNTRVDAAT